jgi:hypothetical protein
MAKRIAEEPMRSRSRTIGVVYLLYFLTAIGADVLASRNFAVTGDVVNVIATAL